jgi:hypothetical protein
MKQKPVRKIKNLIAYAMADDVAVSSPQPGLQKQQRVIDCSITLFETHPD